jgi:hypothetical protein
MVRMLSPRLDLNDMGFQPSFNMYRIEAVAGYTHRDPTEIFRNWAVIPFVNAQMNTEGVPQEALVGVDGELTFKNFFFTSPQLFLMLPGTYDTLETFDGARFENKPRLDFNWGSNTNSSKEVSGHGRFLARTDLDGDAWSVGFVGGVAWQARSNLELALEPEIGVERNAVRFYDCSTDGGGACLVEDGTRHYLFADLDSQYLSFTFRGTYTLLTTLSLQAYAQLFLAEGTWDDYREVDTMGEHPTIDRDDLVPSLIDFDDDGFDETALNVNVVLRWEPMPGSTLFLVYTRAQQASTVRLRDLDTGPTEEVVLFKLQYYVI